MYKWRAEDLRHSPFLLRNLRDKLRAAEQKEKKWSIFVEQFHGTVPQMEKIERLRILEADHPAYNDALLDLAYCSGLHDLKARLPLY